MNIYVYSDESGVFDKAHNDYYVFGGIICLGKAEKDKWARVYSKVEKDIRNTLYLGGNVELKASVLQANHKNSIYRALNNCYKFGAVIDQHYVHDKIFLDKKSKQRYLDYAYKIAVKNALQRMIELKIFDPDDVKNICFSVDEHTTATNGKYELREALEQELKIGTINYQYNRFYEPIFPRMESVELAFCDSATVRLIRAADIVANHFYYIATKKGCNYTYDIKNRNSFIKMLP